MTTRPKEPPARPDTGDDVAIGERTGSIVLRLDALGLDFRAADFSTRFIEFCEANDDYEMEINEAGELVILPMTGLRGNRQETETNIELGLWQRVNGGVNVSQSSRFRLASGAIRGPDAAWITQERYDAATEEERETVFPGAPDFVVEIQVPHRQPRSIAAQDATVDRRRRSPGLAHRPAQSPGLRLPRRPTGARSAGRPGDAGRRGRAARLLVWRAAVHIRHAIADACHDHSAQITGCAWGVSIRR